MAGNDILSRIQILLDANTANFEQNLQNAQQTSVSTFDKIKSSAKVMGTAVAAGAASAVGALAAMAWETANQAAELEKFAFRANTTTQDFQKMAVGAQAYGIEQEALSDMMKDFNEKLGELTTIGAGGGVDFFEQIAVKTEGSAAAAEKLILKMQKLSGPEALQLYVDKLEEAGVTQQQMSFYLESMASDMTDLIPLLINGGEGMKLYSDAAERAGIVMNDETIAKAKILKEQMYLLDLQLQGAKNQLMQAVIPAFVDIAQAFFGGSEQGIQFSGVAEGIAKVLKGVAAVAIGAVTSIQLLGKALGGMAAIGGAIWNETDWYEMNPIGLVKAAYEARAEISALTNEMKADMHSTIIGAADRLDGMWNSTSSGTAAQMAALRSVEKTTGGVNAGLGTLVEKQDKAAKASSGHSKALREQSRILEEQKRILYEYSTADDQKSLKLAEEIERLKSNGMSQYVPLAQARYDEEKKLAEMQFAWEVAEHRFSENEKLAYSYNIKEQEIKTDALLTKEQRAAKLQSLREQFEIENRELRISQQKQLLEIRKTWMDASDYAEQYYALVREEILNTASYSPEMKDTLIKQANIQQGVEQNAERESVWSDYQSRFGEQDYYQQDVDLLQSALDQKLISEKEYHKQRQALQMQWGMSYVQGAAGVMAQVFGEQSTAYQAMFAMQKALAIAEVYLNAPKTYSSVLASASTIPVVGPFIAPGLAAGAVALQMAQAAMIGSVSFQPTGMAHDGIDRVPEEGSWWLDKGERVLKEQTSSKLDSTLDEIRRTNREPAYDMPSVQQPIYNIQALDGKSVERVLKKHNRHVAGSMKGYARNFGR